MQCNVLAELGDLTWQNRMDNECETQEKYLKLDAAAQLLELHKTPRTLASNTSNISQGNGSDTVSDSGDKVGTLLKVGADKPVHLFSSGQGIPGKSSTTVTPSGTSSVASSSCQLNSNRYSSQCNDQVDVTSLHQQAGGIQVQVRNAFSPQTGAQLADQSPSDGVQIIKECQSRNTAAEKEDQARHSPVKPSLSQVQVSSLFVREKGHKQPVECAVIASSNVRTSSSKTETDCLAKDNGSVAANTLRLPENISHGDSAMPNASKGGKTVSCHHVSVIQYYSSSLTTSKDLANKGRSMEETSNQQELGERFGKTSTSTEHCGEKYVIAHDKKMVHQTENEPLQPTYTSMNHQEFMANVPQERIPYVPFGADHMIPLQSWNSDMKDHIAGKYSWAFGNDKMRDGTMPVSSCPSIKGRPIMFSQGNAQSAANMYDTRALVGSDNTTQSLVRGQAKSKLGWENNAKLEISKKEESETSDASESGEAMNTGQYSGENTPLLSPSESLG